MFKCTFNHIHRIIFVSESCYENNVDMPELVTDVPHLPHKQYVIEDTLKVVFFYTFIKM